MRVWFAGIAAVGLVAGCGDAGGGSRVPVYPITGKIITPAGPLADAAVTFAPKSGQPTAHGRTNAQGEFRLTTYDANDGAAAGEYAVVVTKVSSTATGQADDEGHSADPYAPDPTAGGHSAQPAGGATALVPPQYMSVAQTPLSATVSADGDRHFEFTVE